jgi:hypothetical protein
MATVEDAHAKVAWLIVPSADCSTRTLTHKSAAEAMAAVREAMLAPLRQLESRICACCGVAEGDPHQEYCELPPLFAAIAALGGDDG